jgi:NAD-reducing hydrogenase large subunit
VDTDGLVRKANLLIATSQNNLAMNQAVEQTAKHFVLPRQLREGMLNRVEAAIRCYDPCLSCSTHALGKMPLMVEVRNRAGELLDRVARS